MFMFLVDITSTISSFLSAIDMGVNTHDQNMVFPSYSCLFGTGFSGKDIYHLWKLKYSPVVEQSWTVAIVMCSILQLRHIYNSVVKILSNILELRNFIPSSLTVKKRKVHKQLHLFCTFLCLAFMIICVV